MLSVVQWFGFGNIRQLAASLSAHKGGFGQLQPEHSPGAPDLRGFVFKRTVAGKQVSLASGGLTSHSSRARFGVSG